MASVPVTGEATYGYVTPKNGFTIELWFKRDANPTTFETLFNQRTQASVNWTIGGLNGIGRQLLMEINSAGALSLQMINEGATSGTTVASWTDPSPGGYASDNQWHHLVLRMPAPPGTIWRINLDGAELAQGNVSSPLNWNPGVLTFGAQYAPHVGDWGSYLWSKWMAYIAVWNKYLPPTKAVEHYTAGSGGTVYYGDDEVERLIRIADWAEVPDQAREFEPALVELQGIQVDGANALTSMQDTAFAASGLLFSDGQSRIVYHNRRHRYNRWNVATFAESTDSAPEVGLTFTIDDANIYNDVRGDRPYGSTVRIVDDDSKAAHGRKTYSFSIPVTTHDELRNAVQWISAQYGSPRVRISEITLRAESSDVIEWAGTGGVTIGDHITLDELPTDAAPEVTMEFIVEQIHLNVDIKNRIYEVSFQLSPFDLQRTVKIGVSNLGDTYKVGY
jgi:concanavalin A-like lectin/glucanase superfamily protein